MEIDKDILERYVRGLASPEEADLVEHWLSTCDPADTPIGIEERHVNKIWIRLAHLLEQPAESDTIATDTRRKPWRFLSKAAAMFALVVGLGWFGLRERENNHEVVVAEKMADARITVIKTAKGERKTIQLPDGSTVRLNSESEISFPELLLSTDTLRAVNLTGEAFFDVVADASRPFLVNTAASGVRVLGTRFNVREYPEDHKTIVVVEEGSVRLSHRINGADITLIANEMGEFSVDGHPGKSNVYPGRYISWSSGKLIFENQTLLKAAKELERWYDVKITMETSRWNSNRYTGSFSSKPIEEVLETMAYAIGFNYKIEGKTINIY